MASPYSLPVPTYLYTHSSTYISPRVQALAECRLFWRYHFAGWVCGGFHAGPSAPHCPAGSPHSACCPTSPAWRKRKPPKSCGVWGRLFTMLAKGTEGKPNYGCYYLSEFGRKLSRYQVFYSMPQTSSDFFQISCHKVLFPNTDIRVWFQCWVGNSTGLGLCPNIVLKLSNTPWLGSSFAPDIQERCTNGNKRHRRNVRLRRRLVASMQMPRSSLHVL